MSLDSEQSQVQAPRERGRANKVLRTPDSSTSAPGETSAAQEEQRRKRLVSTASRYFIDAAGGYSSSKEAQGTAIAQMCQRDGLLPSELGDVLLSDNKRLLQLSKAAMTYHRRVIAAREKTALETNEETEETEETEKTDKSTHVVTKQTEPPTRIEIERTRKMVNTVFGWAESLMILSKEDLQRALDLYPQEDEIAYAETLRGMIKQRKRQLWQEDHQE